MCKTVVCSFVGAAMMRKLLARVLDLHDQPVGPASGTVLQASAFDTLQDRCGRAVVDDRAVMSYRTLAHAAMPLSDSPRWPDWNASLDSLDEPCLSLGPKNRCRRVHGGIEAADCSRRVSDCHGRTAAVRWAGGSSCGRAKSIPTHAFH